MWAEAGINTITFYRPANLPRLFPRGFKTEVDYVRPATAQPANCHLGAVKPIIIEPTIINKPELIEVIDNTSNNLKASQIAQKAADSQIEASRLS